MALQKVYAAELFFFGQSFKICERTREVRVPPPQPPPLPLATSFNTSVPSMRRPWMEGENEVHLMSRRRRRRHWLSFSRRAILKLCITLAI